MLSVAKHLKKICWAALISCLLVLPACVNDLKKIQQLSASQLNMDVDTIHRVDIIYSDSAKVKFRITAPLLLQYQGKRPYNLMPKTVNVAVFENMVQTGSIVADTGIQSDIDKKIQFRKNVVATNDKGETFKSDELIWDQTTKTVHSNKMVQIHLANGDIMNGTGFVSDDKMKHWTMTSSTAILNVSDAPTQ
jgi:LPS export ABC transporter protein LptC